MPSVYFTLSKECLFLSKIEFFEKYCGTYICSFLHINLLRVIYFLIRKLSYPFVLIIFLLLPVFFIYFYFIFAIYLMDLFYFASSDCYGVKTLIYFNYSIVYTIIYLYVYASQLVLDSSQIIQVSYSQDHNNLDP